MGLKVGKVDLRKKTLNLMQTLVSKMFVHVLVKKLFNSYLAFDEFLKYFLE